MFGPWAKQKEVQESIVEVLDDTVSLEDSNEDTHSDTGVLKTASQEYPRDYLNDTSKYPSRGDHICRTSTTDVCSLIALGWKDKTVKTFVSTCGTTLPGMPHQKHRYSHSGAIITNRSTTPTASLTVFQCSRQS
ncbi:hypothetical protein EMCRGX_G034902 [Ephydatia muelleri]